MAKTKFYVVFVGRKPGIYTTWDETKNQVSGFPGALHKSFSTLEEAESEFTGLPINHKAKALTYMKDKHKFVYPSISVDAACSGNPGMLEYQGVDTLTREVLFKVGPIANGTNNLGEYFALVHGMKYLSDKKSSIPIYTDSKTGQNWVEKRTHNSTVSVIKGSPVDRLINRSKEVLSDLQYKGKILKWDTKNWGEIPADFGRK